MSMKHFLHTVLFLLCGLCWSGQLTAEPLRVLVPVFFGPEPISQQVRTTLYFEMIKAFRTVDASDKGAWILYGQEKVEQSSHDAIVASASWPSVRADLVIWGQVHQYGDGVVMQLYLSLTPLVKQRQVRPELWKLALRNSAGQLDKFELDMPGQFYTFEPLLLTREAILQFSSPQGISLYSSRQEGQLIGKVAKDEAMLPGIINSRQEEQPIGKVADVMRFYEIHDDAIRILTGGREGWVRIRPITQQESEAVAFSKGLVRLLLGDWRGARQSFATALDNPNLPQELRIHALLYSGLAKEKGGVSGRSDFEAAYLLNQLDRSVASYLLMSRLADLSLQQTQGNSGALNAARQRLQQTLDSTRVLFAADDAWFKRINNFIP